MYRIDYLFIVYTTLIYAKVRKYTFLMNDYVMYRSRYNDRKVYLIFISVCLMTLFYLCSDI